MTRTSLIVERNKRRQEIRDNIKFTIFVFILLLAGIIPFSLKVDQMYSAEDAETNQPEYIRVISTDDDERGAGRNGAEAQKAVTGE